MSAYAPGLGLGGENHHHRYAPVVDIELPRIPVPAAVALHDPRQSFFTEDRGPHHEAEPTGCAGCLVALSVSCASLRRFSVVSSFWETRERNLRERFPTLLNNYVAACAELRRSVEATNEAVDPAKVNAVVHAEKALFGRIFDLTEEMGLKERRGHLNAAQKIIDERLKQMHLGMSQKTFREKIAIYMRSHLVRKLPYLNDWHVADKKKFERFQKKILKDAFLTSKIEMNQAIKEAREEAQRRKRLIRSEAMRSQKKLLQDCQRAPNEIAGFIKRSAEIQERTASDLAEADKSVENAKADKAKKLAEADRLMHELFMERHFKTSGELDAFAAVVAANPYSVGSDEERVVIDAVMRMEMRLDTVGFGASFLENARNYINRFLGREKLGDNLAEIIEARRRDLMFARLVEHTQNRMNNYVAMYRAPEAESEDIVLELRYLCCAYRDFMMGEWWPARNKGASHEEISQRFRAALSEGLAGMDAALHEEAHEAFDRILEEEVLREFIDDIPEDSAEKERAYKKMVDCGFFNTTEEACQAAQAALAARAI